MKRLLASPLLLLPWLASLSSTAQGGSVPRSILPGFESPANDYRPKFRYWLPDASVPAESVVRDVEAMEAVGAGGIEFLPFFAYGIAPPDNLPTDWRIFGFGTESFKKLFVSALNASNEADLRFDFALGAGQGQGVPAKPESAGLAMELVYGAVSVNGGELFQGSLPEPNIDFHFEAGFMNAPEKFGSNELIGVVTAGVKSTLSSETVLDESTLSDVTHSVINGTLEWRAPKQHANYTLFAFYQRYTNQRSCTSGLGAKDIIANGSWIVDHFSETGAKKITDFWDKHLLDDETKDLLRAAGEYSWEDSMEIQASLFWTQDFVKVFEANRGYSPIKYLPIYFNALNQWSVVGPPYNTTYVLDRQETEGENYLQDYRMTLDEGYTKFLTHYQSWANSLGLNHSAQVAYNLPLDMPGHVPEVGTPELESLGFPTIDSALHFVGAAHLSGRNIISTEVGAMALGSYTQTIPKLVDLFKDSFAAGVNMMVIHGYPYNGEYVGTTWPGYDPLGYAFTDTWNDRQPAWQYMNDTMAYAARNSLVLQTGTPRVDLAFYFYEQPWRGIDSFKGDDLRAAGYSHEYLGSTNLVSAEAVVRNGTLAPDGPAYRGLVISNQTYITSEASAKLLEFAAGGLPIFIIGNIPNITIGTHGQADVSANMDALVKKYPNVHVLKHGSSLNRALQTNGVKPRASVQNRSGSGSLYTFWRSDVQRDVELVYLYNKGSDTSVEFAFETAKDAVPFVLDAWTGQQTPLLVYNISEGRLATTVSLKENQTAILAFSSHARKSDIHIISHSQSCEKFQINSHGRIEALVGDGKAEILLSNGDRKVVAGRRKSTTGLPKFKVGPWNLTVKSYGPSSNASTVSTNITTIEAGKLSSLRPWTNITGLEQISGIGIYRANFTLPKHCAGDDVATLVKFGPVLHTLRAWVNGHLLPPVDISDAESDITRWVVAGANEIKIEVSSTLFNAVKANLDTVKSIGFGPRDPKTYAEADYVAFGLVGPVTVRTLRKVPVA
ncbi:hypothetical protein FAGAP_12315 [Fusarium agapanthi]|uniref:Secreted protein n=1 Tax=Fusarium agapanthi TaxID=1803897 RepID=A0A9P5AXM3_9HYPO|nr:hypothetical protein FAGAP_12315 [Fusarium agapanthi]